VPNRRSSRLLAALVALVLFTVVACGNENDRPSLAEGGTRPPTSASPPPATLDPDANIVATANQPGELAVYEQPDAPESFTSLPNPTAYGAPLTFLVKDKATITAEWIDVYLPIRPNGSSGFVKASDVTLSPHDWRIEVRLGEFNLKVYEGDELFLDAAIGVAKDNTPTPGGLYYTTELLQPPDPNGPYGTYAYGLSGFSDVLTSFNGGPGQLGIHGTNTPEAIGTQVSSGCIRLNNAEIEKLAPVLPLGVPVEIIT
jgi:hypothetical protein